MHRRPTLRKVGALLTTQFASCSVIAAIYRAYV